MLLGPLFRFELMRLARRGTHLPLRVVLAVLLFVGLIASYLQLFPGADVFALLFGGADAAEPSRLDRFGETFLFAFLLIQQVAVLLLTPVYAGGAIAEEKEKGRLDFLLTTTLGRWELVLGKLAARLVFVLGVVAVGLPVLSFTLLFGGVDPGRVLAGFVVAVVSAVSVGAFAVMLSVLRPTLRDVLLWAFGGLAASGVGGLVLAGVTPEAAGGVASPVTVLFTLFRVWGENQSPFTDPTWPLVGLYAGIHLTTAVWSVLIAVVNVRPAVRRDADSPVPVPPPIEPESPPPAPAADDPPPPAWYAVPERAVFTPHEIESAADGRDFLVPTLGDDEDPLAWKERHFGSRLPLLEGRWFAVLRGCLVIAFVLALGMGVFIGLMLAIQSGRDLHFVTNGVARVVLVVATLVLPFAGLRAAVGVAEERAKKTLDSLFALPLDRSDILKAKVWAAVGPARWWAVGAAVAVALAVFTGGLNVLCIPGLVAVYGGYAVFTLGVGVLLSVWCKTGVRAVLAHVVVTLVTFAGPFLLAPFLNGTPVVFSPPAAVVMAAATPNEFGGASASEGTALYFSFLVGLGYAGAGVLAWRLAARRFERE